MQMPMRKCLASIFLVFLCISLLTGCGEPSVSEVSRLSDVSNSVDVVVAIRNTDATVATPTEVYLLPKAAKPKGDPIFRADQVDDLRVSWSGSSELTIQAKEARPFVSRADYQVKLPSGEVKRIAIRLVIQKVID